MQKASLTVRSITARPVVLKLKRPVVEREYAHLIEEMYEGTREA